MRWDSTRSSCAISRCQWPVASTLWSERQEYDEYFTAGSEVETWKTPDELMDKIRYYLEHESERKAIAEAGRKRARSDHTWEKRFDMLFADLG